MYFFAALHFKQLCNYGSWNLENQGWLLSRPTQPGLHSGVIGISEMYEMTARGAWVIFCPFMTLVIFWETFVTYLMSILVYRCLPLNLEQAFFSKAPATL